MSRKNQIIFAFSWTLFLVIGSLFLIVFGGMK